jgi:hypothetical protein
MDDDNTQGWAYQQQLLEEEWNCATDFSVDERQYFSSNGNEFNRNQLNTGE